MMIMVKKTVTLLLIGLMAVSSISGSLTVVCHGADGHIAVESLVHNHCECPQDGQQGDITLIGNNCPGEHGHCQDYVLASHLITPSNNAQKQSIHQSFTPCLIHPVDSLIHLSLLGNFSSQDDKLPAFHTPLRTVILLA